MGVVILAQVLYTSLAKYIVRYDIYRVYSNIRFFEALLGTQFLILDTIILVASGTAKTAVLAKLLFYFTVNQAVQI